MSSVLGVRFGEFLEFKPEMKGDNVHFYTYPALSCHPQNFPFLHYYDSISYLINIFRFYFCAVIVAIENGLVLMNS